MPQSSLEDRLRNHSFGSGLPPAAIRMLAGRLSHSVMKNGLVNPPSPRRNAFSTRTRWIRSTAFREYLTIVSNTDARPAAEAQAPTEVYTYTVRKAKRKFRLKVHAGMRLALQGGHK